MSLINKVLRDLESQRDSASERRGRSPLVDESLRPVRPVKSQISRQQLIRIGLVLAVVTVGAFAWSQWGVKLLERGKAVLAPVPPSAKIAAEPVTAPNVAAPPVVAKSPAELAKGTAPPPAPAIKSDAPKPPSTDPNKLATPSAKPLQDVVIRKPKAEPASPGKPDTVAAPEPPVKAVTAKAKEPIPEETPAIEETETLLEEPTGKTVLEKKIKPLSLTDKAENEYRLAAASLQQKRTGEAEAHLRVALAAQSTHVKARELLAGLLLQGGRWREAQLSLEQGVSQNPTHYPFAQLLARSYVDHGQEKKALELLERSREAAGTDAEYSAFLATLYQRNGRHPEAVKLFTEAVTLRPQEGRWWLGFAISLEATEQWKASSEAYQRAITSGSLDRQLLQYSQGRLAAVKNR